MTQEEIIAANRASAEREAREDWVKGERLAELRTEERIRPAPKHPRYFPEDTKEDILSAIEAENIKTSQ